MLLAFPRIGLVVDPKMYTEIKLFPVTLLTTYVCEELKPPIDPMIVSGDPSEPAV